MSKKKLMSGISIEEHPLLKDYTLKEGVVPVDPNKVFPEENVDVETLIVDQGNTLKEVATIEKTINDTLIVKDSLSGAKEVIQGSLDEGGLKETSAQLLEVLAKNTDVFAQKDIKEESITPLPSVENYTYVREREINSQIALESINDRLRSIMQWFIEKLKSLIISIKSFADRNTFLIDALDRRIKRVQHKTEGLNHSAPTREVENQTLATALAIKGSFPVDIVENLKNMRALTNSLLQWRNSYEVKDIVTRFKTLTNGIGQTKDFIQDILTPPPGLTKESTQPDEFLSIYSSADIFGNRKIYFTTFRDFNLSDKVISENLPHVGGRLEYVEGARMPSSKIKIVALKDLKILLEISQGILSDIRGYKKDLLEITRQLEDLTRFASTQLNTISTASDDRQRLIGSIAFALPKLINRPILQFSNYSANVVRNIVNYVDLSIKPIVNEK